MKITSLILLTMLSYNAWGDIAVSSELRSGLVFINQIEEVKVNESGLTIEGLTFENQRATTLIIAADARRIGYSLGELQKLIADYSNNPQFNLKILGTRDGLLFKNPSVTIEKKN